MTDKWQFDSLKVMLAFKTHLCTECADSFRRWLHGTEKAADVLPKGDEK